MATNPSNQDCRTLLLASAAATRNVDQTAAIRLLLRTGANIHDWDVNGNTCLHLILAAAQPDQPWTVQTLAELLQAGADPSQANHTGFSAFDMACFNWASVGSFRRDILLQALIESGSDVTDDRLLIPPKLTSSYTAFHHALVRGDAHATATFYLRRTLTNKLACTTGQSRRTAPESILYDVAVDRVLFSHANEESLNIDIAFDQAFEYLQSMVGVKKQVAFMFEERVPYNIWLHLRDLLNVPQAEVNSLLEFDWFRYVDPEDVFLNQVDNLIQQLEDFSPGAISFENVKRLIQILESTLQRSPNSGAEQLESSPAMDYFDRSPEEEQVDFYNVQEVEPPHLRKESIVPTPVRFYMHSMDE